MRQHPQEELLYSPPWRAPSPLLHPSSRLAPGSQGSGCPYHGWEEVGAFKRHCNPLGRGSGTQPLYSGCVRMAACARGCDRGGISCCTNESIHVLALHIRGAESHFHGLPPGISFLCLQTFLTHRLMILYHL